MTTQYKPSKTRVILRCLFLPIFAIKEFYKQAYNAGSCQFISTILIPIFILIGTIVFLCNLYNPQGMIIGLLIAITLPFITFMVNLCFHCYSYAEKTLIDEV